MTKRTLRLRRLVAAITLPFVMASCVTWQQRDLTDLQDVLVSDQPEEIRLRTSTSDAELTIEHPQLLRDTISGSHDGSVAKIPFADVTNLSVRKDPNLLLGGLAAVGFAALIYTCAVFVGMEECFSP